MTLDIPALDYEQRKGLALLRDGCLWPESPEPFTQRGLDWCMTVQAALLGLDPEYGKWKPPVMMAEVASFSVN